ncbi:MAG: NADH-quinone oxidoreductase subunit M, partial [Promicromonosporaceae bacterium]|nr:NADH-quinone oxidoreductase subunit M [Promicromonosporaceae bacterium]
FLLFSLTGGLIMLVGMIALYFQVPAAQRGPETFLLDNLAGLPLSLGAGRLIFLSFFIAFAIKAPLFPVHTWLPDTVEAARPGTSTLLVCVLDKVGTFGMLTLCLPLFPEAARWAAPVIGWLAVFSILYGAVLAIGQRDLLRLIGYTSVSHFGFIVLGIFVFQPTATAGAALMMLNHGLSTAALFLIAGFVIARHPNGSQQIADYGGLRVAAPVLGGTFLVAVLSAAALPGLATFVSELLVIVGSFPANRPAALVSILAVALAALYALWTYQRIFTGSPARWAGSGAALDESALGGGQGRGVAGPPAAVAPADLVARERVVAGVLIAALVLLGAVPQLGLRYVDAPATQVANSVTEVAS